MAGVRSGPFAGAVLDTLIRELVVDDLAESEEGRKGNSSRYVIVVEHVAPTPLSPSPKTARARRGETRERR